MASIAVSAAAALFLKVYLHNHPLPSSFTSRLQKSDFLSPSCRSSRSLKIINPSNNIIKTDSIAISLSKAEVGGLTDEEILARFVKGFFGGLVFAPERALIAGLKTLKMSFIPVNFAGWFSPSYQFLRTMIETWLTRCAEGVEVEEKINDLSQISSTTLPPANSLFFDSFLLLDSKIGASQSFIEFGFGDDQKQFSGFHRVEILRMPEIEEGGDENEKKSSSEVQGEAKLWYSSTSCNPTQNKPPFPELVMTFHKAYGGLLFRDGLREVLGRK
jgi:hypothetical protein